MPSDQFAVFLGEEMGKVNSSLKHSAAEVVRDESISSTIFAELSGKELEEVFGNKIGIKYGLGIKKGFEKVQEMIRNRQEKSEIVETFSFRPYCKSSHGVKYSVCTIQNMQGETLLDPVHYFLFPSKANEKTVLFFAKEVVKFATACVNARQNGTIHFGVQPKENGTGLIKGLDFKLDERRINVEISNVLSLCFAKKEQQTQVRRCIGPVQVVPIQDGLNVVLEIDIVPNNFYLSDKIQVYTVLYPPRGQQKQTCFLYEETINAVETFGGDRVEAIKEDLLRIVQRRQDLETSLLGKTENKTYHITELKKCLTAGNTYITDQLYPIFVVGGYSGLNNAEAITKVLSELKTAFLSTHIVFDFDSSTALIKAVEKEKQYFQVVTSEDVKEGQQQNVGNVWFYCNGNDELSQRKHLLEEYLKIRDEGVRHAITTVLDLFGSRTQIIVLVFERLLKGLNDPFPFFLEDLSRVYKQTPIIVSDSEDNLRELKQSYAQFVDKTEIKTIFHTGLDWEDSLKAVASVFRHESKSVCKLPDYRGGYVEMSLKEKQDLKVDDLEIISGDQCSRVLYQMTDTERRKKETETKAEFFRGNEVSWWNFKFDFHVCKREAFDNFKEQVKNKITNGENRFEIVEIQHQPGAGGTTLGRHIMWHFSQFENASHKKYRCCVINNIRKGETAAQITRFRNFEKKDDTEAEPVIALIDNKTDDMLKHFKDDIDVQAYRNGSLRKVFCILVIVTRVATFDKKTIILQHKLSPAEISWFENRYEENMKSFGEAHVKSLIAFNVMKENFNRKYIEETTEGIMKGLSTKEVTLVQHLSLVNYFDLFESPMPPSIFDDLMGVNDSSHKRYYLSDLIGQRPIGLCSFRSRSTAPVNKTWNTEVSESCSLLLKDRRIENESIDTSKGNSTALGKNANTKYQALAYQQGVVIVSPLVALAILKIIQKTTSKTLTCLVDELLEFTKNQRKDVGTVVSEYFIGIVCSLFKTRETRQQADGKEIKEKFSKLVKGISEKDCELHDDKGEPTGNVLHLLKKCCHELNDPYVGQQLARYYYIKLGEFDEAEREIRLSIDKVKTNPFFYDTLGQIYRSKLKKYYDMTSNTTDETAKDILEAATMAIKYFVEAQKCHFEITQSGDSQNQKYEPDEINSSFLFEVDTALLVLEKHDKLICFGEENAFMSFINGTSDDKYNYLQPCIEQLRKGRTVQKHVEDSLRHLEYKRSMIKRKYRESASQEDDMFTRKLRVRFTNIYGKADRCKTAETFQSLKDLYLIKGIDAIANLASAMYTRISTGPCMQEADLLRYIGSKVILVSSLEGTLSNDEYRDMLHFTKELFNRQIRHRRPYIEAYLYFALFHWPLESRLAFFSKELCNIDKYTSVMDEWRNKYEERFKRKPTLYFALAVGKPGNDVIDQDVVRRKWHTINKGERLEVKRVDIWNDPNFRDKYVCLEGIMDATGNFVKYEVGVVSISVV